MSYCLRLWEFESLPGQPVVVVIGEPEQFEQLMSSKALAAGTLASLQRLTGALSLTPKSAVIDRAIDPWLIEVRSDLELCRYRQFPNRCLRRNGTKTVTLRL